MTATRATGKEIRQAVEYWRLALGLDGWNFTVQIGPIPDGHYGTADVQVPYKKAHLRFYPKGMQENGETVDGMVVHEILHLVGEPLAAFALAKCKTDKDKQECEDLEEALVTELERLVLRLHKRAKP